MASRTELKNRAKRQLGNGIFQSAWLSLLVVGLIQTALVSFASGAFVVGALIISGPLSVGVAYVTLKQARTGELDIGEMFCGFRYDFVGALALFLLQNLFIFLWSLLFIVPGVIKAYAYSMAFFVKSDHADYDWKACLSESERLTAGHKGELFLLDLSFIGWYFVGSLCLGVGTFWVAAYHMAAKAQFYEELTRVN